MQNIHSPFHSGEIEAQRRAGIENLAARVGGFIRDHMPDQHREFFSSLPFLVVAAADASGRPWTTIIEGREGFISSPTARKLTLETSVDSSDPLADAFSAGTDIGMVGIELATRRRNRMNGFLQATPSGFEIEVSQSFGNCPQYINERSWYRTEAQPQPAIISTALSARQQDFIRASDTLFIGSGQQDEQQALASNGYDASHRGGPAGFVEVIDERHLRIPDYSGNNFFNTIGNLLKKPAVSLLFVDFQSGSLLHLTGSARIDWQVSDSDSSGVQRAIDIRINQLIERPAALNLRWRSAAEPMQKLTLLKRVRESQAVSSFYFGSADERPLAPFKAGQHLPLELQLPNLAGKAKRSYSLSAAPNGHSYRLSIKREAHGLASRYLHEQLQCGDLVEASRPGGDFSLPAGREPVLLVSAGIGITPMMAMLEQIVHDGDQRPTYFVHSARDGANHALREQLRQLKRPYVQTQIYYSQARPEDQAGLDFDVAGRITSDALLKLNAPKSAHYLLCGPAGFVASLQSGLEASGIPAANIHFETF